MKIFFLLLVVLVAVSAQKRTTSGGGGSGTTSGGRTTGSGSTGLQAVRGQSSRLSAPRSGVQAAVLNNYELYAVGGTSANNVELNTVDKYSFLTNTWRAVAPLSINRNGPGVAGLDGLLWAFGGATDAGIPVFSTEIYNPETNQWFAGPSLNFRRWNLGAVTICTEIYAIGGYDLFPSFNNSIGTVTNVEVYSRLTGIWQSTTSLPESRAAFATVVLNGEIWVLGGTREFITGQAQNPITTTLIFNTTSATWRFGPPLLTSRVGFGAAVIDNKIFIAGGRTQDGPIVTDIDYYDPYAGALGFQRAPFRLNNGRFNNAVAGLGPFLFLVGGRTQNNNKFSFTNSVDVINIIS